MYQAIQTKFIGPTNHRGARVKAYGQVGSVTVPYDYSQQREGAHHIAAKALAEKFGWCGVWVYGGSADGKGNVYVNVTGTTGGTDVRSHAGGTFAFEILPE